MKRIPLILLDVDGVLADFAGSVLKLFGLTKPARDAWDLMDADLVGGEVETETKMWERIHLYEHDFWAQLDELPWAREVYDLCKKFAKNVRFCTSPSRSPWSASGKYRWLEKFAGSHEVRNLHITPKKHDLAKPGSLLIDDHLVKIERFTKHGGMALAFPGPWSVRPDLVRDPPALVEHVHDELIHNLLYGLQNV